MVMGTAMDSGSLLVTLMWSWGISLGLTLQLKTNDICSDWFMMRRLRAWTDDGETHNTRLAWPLIFPQRVPPHTCLPRKNENEAHLIKFYHCTARSCCTVDIVMIEINRPVCVVKQGDNGSITGTIVMQISCIWLKFTRSYLLLVGKS